MEDQDIINEFLIESNENLGRLDQEMVELERRPQDAELLASVFRTFHTIKGTCGFLAFGKLEQIAHQAENMLSQFRSGALELSADAASLILEAVDAMRAHLTSIAANGREASDDPTILCARLEKASRPTAALQAAPVVASETPSATQKVAGGMSDAAIRVDVHLLDKLMNLVGELVLTRNQILQFSAQNESVTLNTTSQRLNLITSELQEGVMKTRMQPIGVVWNKLPRMVRDVSLACGKQIAIDMQGADTEMDKTIIEAIKDPLTHIVRNCCDHGIERPEIRAERGKFPQGRLSLRAFHEGGQVIIEIADDGGGVDVAKVTSKALHAGIIRPDQAERLTEREALNLLFTPGFSTAEKVTNVSGRGVGMDVVRTNIEKIGGTVDLSSRMGEGTTVKLKIPLTLAIIPGLVVALGDRRSAPRRGEPGVEQQFVIPQVNLVELVRLEGDGLRSMERIRETTFYRLRGNLLPIVYLREVLGLHTEKREATVVNIAVLQADDRQFGLVVDSIKDTQEIVVKPLGKHLKGLTCYAGATIMGDGRVALILDVLGIAQHCGAMEGNSERARVDAETRTQHAQTSQSFLLFRAGPFARLAAPLSLVARLEKFPLNKVERAGNRLVVQYRGEILPLVPLASILDPACQDTSSTQDPVQAIVFNDGHRRIGLLVDELLDIIDDIVTTKRASGRKGLLGSAVIGNHVTDLLDFAAVVAAVPADWSSQEAAASSHGTVMLAEGSSFSRGLLRAALEMGGYRVVEASTSSDALRQLARCKIDVVVAALDLPGGSSELLQQMRRDPALAQVPVLAMTDSSQAAAEQATHSGKFQDYAIRGDSDGVLRSIERLAGALLADSCAADPVGARG